MTKVTLDLDAFKALASDTRLEILRTLDGKKMSLSEISRTTSLNKATLHEHLGKLQQAGLIKRKERQGHKWVYYKLSWKGESLLHPENSKIVVMFAAAFISISVAVIQMFYYVKGVVIQKSNVLFSGDDAALAPEAYGAGNETGGWLLDNGFNETINMTKSGGGFDNTTNMTQLFEERSITESTQYISEMYQNPIFLYIAIICMILFTVLMIISINKYKKNRIQKI